MIEYFQVKIKYKINNGQVVNKNYNQIEVTTYYINLLFLDINF